MLSDDDPEHDPCRVLFGADQESDGFGIDVESADVYGENDVASLPLEMVGKVIA